MRKRLNKFIMVNAQAWLDNSYPKEKRKNIRKIYISENLEGELDLRDFKDEVWQMWGSKFIKEVIIYICPQVDKSQFSIINKSEYAKSIDLVSAQEWLDENYPKGEREEITELSINNKHLSGSLDLNAFVNLKTLYCSENWLTNLDISGCSGLSKIYCAKNQLNTNFLTSLNSEKLTNLEIQNNNLSGDLTIFSRFINCEMLNLYSNPLTGRLTPLQNLKKLKYLSINNTKLDSNWECLPENLEYIWCDGKLAKMLESYREENEHYDYRYDDYDDFPPMYRFQDWKNDHPEIINRAKTIAELEISIFKIQSQINALRKQNEEECYQSNIEIPS